MQRRDKKFIQNVIQQSLRGTHLEDRSVDGSIILKRILKK